MLHWGTTSDVLIHNTVNGRNDYNAHSSIIMPAHFATLVHFENFINAIQSLHHLS